MKIFLLCLCAVFLPQTGAKGFNGGTLAAIFKDTEHYFVTRVNATARDLVHKGIEDVKNLASQGFQALVLNYMNIRAAQKKQKSPRDISGDFQQQKDLMDRVVSLLGVSGQDLHYINKYLFEGLRDVTSDVGDMKTDINTVKSRLEYMMEAHTRYLKSFITNTITAIETRVADHQTDGKTLICPSCFDEVNRKVAQSLKPMVDGLRQIVSEATKTVSQTSEKVLSAGKGLTQKTADIVKALLSKESNIIATLKDRVCKEMESNSCRKYRSLGVAVTSRVEK